MTTSDRAARAAYTRAMCSETFSIDAAPGADSMNTRSRSEAILSIDDPRLDDLDDPAIRRRRRVLAIVGRQFPATTRYVGHDAPFNQGKLKSLQANFGAEDGQDSCTAVNASVMTTRAGANGVFAGGIASHPAYVRFDGTSLPSVGDTYNLNYRDDGRFKHAGIILQVNLHEREFWITADGGQGFPLRPGPRLEREDLRDQTAQYEAAYLVPRTSWCENRPGGRMFLRHYYDRHENGGFSLTGWLDIAHPSVRFKHEAFDAAGAEEDYQELKRNVAV